MILTLMPAYGRDYKSKKALVEDFEAGKDFAVVGYGGSGYTSRSELIAQGHREVKVRYKQGRQVTVLKLPKREPVAVVPTSSLPSEIVEACRKGAFLDSTALAVINRECKGKDLTTLGDSWSYTLRHKGSSEEIVQIWEDA